jgi:addiction module RelB/DinJ family antitoxin
MSNTSTISVAFRIDKELKDEATKILSGLGIDLTTAIRMYLSKVVIHNGIPFAVEYEKKHYTPNEETQAAFAWTQDYIDKGEKSGFKTTEELFKHLEI